MNMEKGGLPQWYHLLEQPRPSAEHLKVKKPVSVREMRIHFMYDQQLLLIYSILARVLLQCE